MSLFLRLKKNTLVIVSSDAEWRAFQRVTSPSRGYRASPYGGWFTEEITPSGRGSQGVIFFQGGWGKIDAAASAQYAITRFKPKKIINIGTAGGFPGLVEKEDIILVSRVVTYDIHEQMSDPDEAVAYYSHRLELPPITLRKGMHAATIVSGDRDLFPEEIPGLAKKYNAVAGDWESGAIAHVAAKNKVPCHIIRGISDIVYPAGSEAYGSLDTFEKASEKILKKLYGLLPEMI